jgi:hypothetical protein
MERLDKHLKMDDGYSDIIKYPCTDKKMNVKQSMLAIRKLLSVLK